MSDRIKVLDLFDEQEDFWKQRAADGIERYRKGNVDFRGFFGDYDIEIETNAGVERKTVNLSKNGKNCYIVTI